MPDATPTRGIRCCCEYGHIQCLFTPEHNAAYAQQLAGLIDGTSPLYGAPPRTHPFPGSLTGRCGICGSWLTCTLFGYERQDQEANHVPHD